MTTLVGEGGCACGAVRYRCDAEAIFVNNCHCILCQRQSGGVSAVNAFVESENVQLLSGELTRHSVSTGSGGTQVIMRCHQCGTAVWSHFPHYGEHGMGIKVGTLDNPGALKPYAVIYTAYRMPWVALPEDIPVFEETYRPADLLSEERMTRLRAMAARAKAEQ